MTATTRVQHKVLSLLSVFALALFPSSSQLAAQGRVKWRYQFTATYIPVRPAVAKDGTVYCVDTNGTLHALQPDGKLKWTAMNAGSRGVDVGGDGTIYTGDPTKVNAYDPSGKPKWSYAVSPVGQTLLGPNVGPDGNIYANASSGLGMFSLTPAGKLRWATPNQAQRPEVTWQELVFRPASKINPLQVIYSAHGVLAHVDCSNGKITQIASGGEVTKAAAQPALGPNGNLYSVGGLDLRAFDPTGKQIWYVRAKTFNSFSNPTVGSDGLVYIVQSGTARAFRPQDGSNVWTLSDPAWMLYPMVSPTNKMIMITGATTWNVPFVRALDMRGNTLWQVDLGVPLQTSIRPMTNVRFTPDGKSAYVGTTYDNKTCYLYAFDTDVVHRGQAWTFGQACPGISRQYPQLSFTGRPALGQMLGVNLSAARVSTPIIYVLGFQRVNQVDLFGAPGCTLYALPTHLVPGTTDSNGNASLSLAIPNIPTLAGLQLFHQYVIADPVNRLAVTSTNGGASVLGL